MSRIGLIAGNGRFPFLVLDAARSLGHDVTVIALREEAHPEIEEAATRGQGRLGSDWQINMTTTLRQWCNSF